MELVSFQSYVGPGLKLGSSGLHSKCVTCGPPASALNPVLTYISEVKLYLDFGFTLSFLFIISVTSAKDNSYNHPHVWFGNFSTYQTAEGRCCHASPKGFEPLFLSMHRTSVSAVGTLEYLLSFLNIYLYFIYVY